MNILNKLAITNLKLNSSLKALDISDNSSHNKIVTEQAIYNYIASGNNGNARLLNNTALNFVYNTGFYFCNNSIIPSP